MRVRTIFGLALLLCVTLASAFADEPWRRRESRGEACFYEHGDYTGKSFCLRPGEQAAQMPYGFNDVVTSMRVSGGVNVTVYRDSDFGGDSQVFTSDVRDFRFVEGGRWNDRISSIRVEDREMRGDDRWGGDRGRPSSGACFYQHGDYSGQSFCLRPGEEAAQMPYGFERQITAMRVFGNASVTVYRDRNLRGESETFDRDVRDLRFIENGRWNDVIASIRVDSDREDDRWPRGRGWGRVKSGACFYLDGDYSGQSFCVRAGETMATLPANFERQITAMRLFGDATVTVYRDRNLRGERQDFDCSVRDFRFIEGGRWNDRIASVRVERGSGHHDRDDD